MTVENFIKKPNQKNWDKSGISGDIEKMKELYNRDQDLAKRFFSCQDWIEMCEFERNFTTRNTFLKNAIRTISSFPECKQVFELDKQFKYFQNFWNKFAHFAVSFDEMHQTMAIFGENKKNLMGRNILSRMIKMAATEEDFDVLSGLISPEQRELTDALCKRAVKKSSLFEWGFFSNYIFMIYSLSNKTCSNGIDTIFANSALVSGLFPSHIFVPFGISYHHMIHNSSASLTYW